MSKFAEGNAIFGWHLGYTDPPRVRSLKGIINSLHLTMDHEVPVPAVKFWESWLILRITDLGNEERSICIVPVLWYDLGHFKHLNDLRNKDVCLPMPVIARSGIGLWFAALLGKSLWKAESDFARLLPADQRQVDAGTVKHLRMGIATMISGKDTDKVYAVSMRYEGVKLWYAGKGFRANKRKLMTLNKALDVADAHDANVQLVKS